MIYTALTKKALRISFNAHKNQIDKSGMPYVYHPYHLAEQMDDEYSTCVALLHDVVEDTDNTFDDLKSEGFPQEIIDALVLMTHDNDIPYMDYIKRMKTNPLAKKVKLADLEHNSDLTRLDNVDDAAFERANKYRQAIFLLRFPESVERIIETIDARETPCCHVNAPTKYKFCPSCGKEIVSAKEITMEYDFAQTLLLCNRCGNSIVFSDHYCGYCGARSSLWKHVD